MQLFVDRLAAVGEDYDPGFGFDAVQLLAISAERLAATVPPFLKQRNVARSH